MRNENKLTEIDFCSDGNGFSLELNGAVSGKCYWPKRKVSLTQANQLSLFRTWFDNKGIKGKVLWQLKR